MQLLNKVCAVLVAVLLPIAAYAQSSPGLSYGQVLTDGQWNSYFSKKLDYSPGAANTVPYWSAGGALLFAPVSGDCSAVAGQFTCTKLNGVAPGALYPLSAGLSLSIAGGTLDVASTITAAGPVGSSAAIPVLTYNTHGQLTAVSTAVPAVSSLNGVSYGASPAVNTVPVVTSASGGGAVTYEAVPNAALANSSLTIAGHSVPLGGSQVLACGDLSNAGTACQATAPAGAIVGTTDTQTLTNKSIDASEITTGTVAAARGGAGAVSGILKANGAGTVSAATAGTDYAPPTSGSSLLSGNGSGGFSNVTIGSGLALAGGTLSSSGGAMVLISTQTASNSAALQWTGLGAAYKDYLLKCSNIIPATTGTIYIQFGEGATPTWQTSGYYWGGYNTTTGTPAGTGGGPVPGIAMSANSVNAAAVMGMDATAFIFSVPGGQYAGAVTNSTTSQTTIAQIPSSSTASGLFSSDTTAKTAIQVVAASGNITSGTCSLYGISN